MQFIRGHEGSWTGTNAFRLMPSDEPFVAQARASVSVAAGGNIAMIHYTWSHPEAGEQDGILVLGPEEASGKVVGFWGDSWHQAPAAKILAGVIRNGVVTVGYSYAGDWEWNILVDATHAQTLRLRMDNVIPQSAAEEHPAGAYWAMQTDLHRG